MVASLATIVKTNIMLTGVSFKCTKRMLVCGVFTKRILYNAGHEFVLLLQVLLFPVKDDIPSLMGKDRTPGLRLL